MLDGELTNVGCTDHFKDAPAVSVANCYPGPTSLRCGLCAFFFARTDTACRDTACARAVASGIARTACARQCECLRCAACDIGAGCAHAEQSDDMTLVTLPFPLANWRGASGSASGSGGRAWLSLVVRGDGGIQSHNDAKVATLNRPCVFLYTRAYSRCEIHCVSIPTIPAWRQRRAVLESSPGAGVRVWDGVWDPVAHARARALRKFPAAA